MATEKRLIDANELLECVHRADERQKTDVWLTSDIEYLLTEQPTVDAVEVVHGRWIPSKSMALSDKCSVCHGWVTRHSVNERKYRYCPNCGAKMDGGKDDGK